MITDHRWRVDDHRPLRLVQESRGASMYPRALSAGSSQVRALAVVVTLPDPGLALADVLVEAPTHSGAHASKAPGGTSEVK